MRRRLWDRLGNGGMEFTEIGFGAAPLGNLYRAIPEEAAQAVLALAWEGGLRYFDTAPLYGYGLSETRLNHFLRDKPRDAYVISTKIGRLLQACPPQSRDGIGKWFEVPSRREVYDYSYDGVMRSLEASLERLGLDRVDILYAHDLDVFNHGSQAALDARLYQFPCLHSILFLQRSRWKDTGILIECWAGWVRALKAAHICFYVCSSGI